MRTKRATCWRRSGCLVVTGSSSASANSPGFSTAFIGCFRSPRTAWTVKRKIVIVKSDRRHGMQGIDHGR